jgi:hypothetical protein
MVLSDQIQNHFVTELEHLPSIGFRELIVLTIGSLSSPISNRNLYTLTRTLGDRLNTRLRFDVPDFSIFTKMIIKLQKQGSLVQKPLASMNAYGVQLSSRGHGEMDGLLYSNPSINKTWNEFRRLAFIAGS